MKIKPLKTITIACTVLTVFDIGIFESALYCGSCVMMMVKFAFSAGSSKHGKARRAFVGSKCVDARYLHKEAY